MDVSMICRRLIEVGAANQTMIRSKNRLINQAKAYGRRAMGWRGDDSMPESVRKRITVAAAKLVEAIEEDDMDYIQQQDPHVVLTIAPVVKALLAGRRPIETERNKFKKEMETLARTLPVWKWAKAVPGLNENALAKVIAETGDLVNYSNPAKVWKRLGMGMVDCHEFGHGWMRQGDFVGLGSDPNKNLIVVKHGYNCFRHSVIWSVTDRMIISQNRHDARSTDHKYGDLYRSRKEYECERNPAFRKDDGTVTIVCELRAKRKVAQVMVRDLWKAWRRLGKIEETTKPYGE